MSGEDVELVYLTVDMWHPDCWTLHATEETDAGLLGYEMTMGQGRFRLYRAYSKSRDELETLLGEIEDTELTEEVLVLSPSTPSDSTAPGLVTRDILVEFNSEPGLREAFTSRGFMHYGPSQHEDGRERRSLLTLSNRRTVDQALGDIENSYDADFNVQRLTTTTPPSSMSALPNDGLSPRQRDAFQLARARGYYEYPRDATAQDLAEELDVTKTTFLEHLRKAERKLLTGLEFH